MKKIAIAFLSILAFGAGILGGCAMSGQSGEEKKNPVQVQSIELSQTGAELNAEQSLTLTATTLPAEAEAEVLTWTSTDRDVVSVVGGQLTAEGRGSAVVRVSTASGVTAECAVIVRDTATFVTVPVGDSINAAVSSLPEDNRQTVTVKLRAGSYVENVVLDRPNVRLIGSNAGETKLYPASVRMPGSKLNADRQNLGVVAVAADNVTIEGLTVDGDNPDFAANLDFLYEGKYAAGHSTDSYTGIFTQVKKLSYSDEYPVSFSGLTVQDCTVRNVFYAGISLSAKHALAPSTGNRIVGNQISGAISTEYGYGIEADKNVYAEITENTVADVQSGVFVNVLNLEGEGRIAQNVISARENGVLLGQITGNGGYDVCDNEIRSNGGAFGLAFLTCTKDDCRALNASGNKIFGFDCGVHVYNSNREIRLSGGSIEGCTTGLYLSDASKSVAGGIPVTLVDVLNVSCTDGVFTDCQQAVRVYSDKSKNNTLLLTGGTIADCERGLVAEVGNGSSAIINVVGSVNFVNVSSEEVAIGAGQINRS